MSDVIPHIATGKLRGLAVTSAQRLASLAEVPTVAESGYPGFEWSGWIGIATPAGTPRPVLEKLSEAVLHAVQMRETHATFARLGIAATPMALDEFSRFIGVQMSKFETAVKKANLKVDK